MAFNTKIEQVEEQYIGYIFRDETLVFTSEPMQEPFMVEAILNSEVQKYIGSLPNVTKSSPITPNSLITSTSNTERIISKNNNIPAPVKGAGSYVPSLRNNSQSTSSPRRCCGRG